MKILKLLVLILILSFGTSIAKYNPNQKTNSNAISTKNSNSQNNGNIAKKESNPKSDFNFAQEKK